MAESGDTSQKTRSTTSVDTRTKRGADAASDHHLVVTNLQLKLKRFTQMNAPSRAKYNVNQLREERIAQNFRVLVANKFQVLLDMDRDSENNLETCEQLWEKSRNGWNEACETVLGKRRIQDKPWISKESLDKIDHRKEKKDLVNRAKTRQQKQNAQQEYQKIHKEVRASIKNDKRVYMEEMAQRGEEAAAKGNLKELYEITRKLAGKWKTTNGPIKDQSGQLLTTQQTQTERWAEYFGTLWNRPPPVNKWTIPPASADLDINCDRPSRDEIKKAIKSLRSGKAAGPDGIPPEALKHSLEESTEMLYLLLGRIWQEGDVPQEWKEGQVER